MEIDNSNRDDEKSAERRKDQARLEVERRNKLEPMRTFEAKLTEKSSAEDAAKKSMQAANRDLGKTKDDKEKILKKILDSSAKNRSDLDHNARVHELELESHRENEQVEQGFEKHLEENADTREAKEDKPVSESKDKGGEISEEGYKRVAEKQEGGGSDSGGSSGGGGSSDTSSGGQGFGSDSGSSDSEKRREHGGIKKLSDLFPASLLTPLNSSGSSGRGFQQDAREFTKEDLDEIVSHVETGINRSGDEFFAVELSNDYFQGLKFMAVRTPQGVVLRFDCPSVAVRSTFIKYRPQIYATLKAKNISVFRIDVV